MRWFRVIYYWKKKIFKHILSNYKYKECLKLIILSEYGTILLIIVDFSIFIFMHINHIFINLFLRIFETLFEYSSLFLNVCRRKSGFPLPRTLYLIYVPSGRPYLCRGCINYMSVSLIDFSSYNLYIKF